MTAPPSADAAADGNTPDAGPACDTDGKPTNGGGGHRRHRRRGDPPCPPCLESLRSYQRNRRRHPDHAASLASPASRARRDAREAARRDRRAALAPTTGQPGRAAAEAAAARDGDWCAYCRSGPLIAAGRPASADHAVPVSRGGADNAANLVLACARCNTLKGTLTADEFRAHLRTTRAVTWPAQRGPNRAP